MHAGSHASVILVDVLCQFGPGRQESSIFTGQRAEFYEYAIHEPFGECCCVNFLQISSQVSSVFVDCSIDKHLKQSGNQAEKNGGVVSNDQISLVESRVYATVLRPFEIINTVRAFIRGLSCFPETASKARHVPVLCDIVNEYA